MAKSKRAIDVEIETTLTVMAFDEVSARRKALAAVAKGRRLDRDVTGTGKTFTYATTRQGAERRRSSPARSA